MTNKKLTDKEIIKALEWYVSKFKNTGYVYLDVDGTKFVSTQEVLDLITRQQAENENLKVEKQSLRSAANSLKMHYEEAQAEIKGLNAKNMLTVSEKNAFRTSFYNGLKQLKTAKAEAVKEFTKTLKEFMHNKFKTLDEYEFEYITERDIDNLVKEMVGENNGL